MSRPILMGAGWVRGKYYEAKEPAEYGLLQQPVGRSHAECGTQLSALSQEVAAFGGVDLFKPVQFG